jgi:ribosome recycling factor
MRTGRANPNMLNGVYVDYYGTMTPLNQTAQISAPEPQLILIKP